MFEKQIHSSIKIFDGSLYMNFKKILILIFAFFFAFAISEIVIGSVVGYPKFNVRYKMNNIRDAEGGSAYIYKPFAKYWTVEGGHIVYERNNLGLPGKYSDTSKKCIYLVGNSFVSALQVDPLKIATSIFQEKLEVVTDSLTVINLGYSGESPYDSFIHLGYYEKVKVPERVMLVISDLNSNRLKKHIVPFVKNTENQLYQVDDSWITKLQIFLRNNFATLNILRSSLSVQQENEIRSKELNKSFELNGKTNEQLDEFTDELKEVLINYREKYQTKFILISIISSANVNASLKIFCDYERITFFSEPINTCENKYNGIGHLNVEGNRKLGELLFNAFIESKSARIR